MGGPGSGNWYRWNTATTLEETKRIDIRYLRKRGMLAPGKCYSLSWTRGGEPAGDIRFSCYDDSLVLHYRFRANSGEWEPVEQRIYFDATPCNYGGARKWFLCPSCDRRVAVLSLAHKYPACRHCYKLPYRSQQKGRYDRLIDQMHKLGHRIFEDYDGYGWRKKKGMHWKTFERLHERYIYLDEQIDNQFVALCAKYIKH